MLLLLLMGVVWMVGLGVRLVMMLHWGGGSGAV